MAATLLWFRQDLRLIDNSAVQAACDLGFPVVPVYLWAPEEEGKWIPGAASRWWLHHSLLSLSKSLKALGLPLLLRSGSSTRELSNIAKEVGASHVVFSRRYDPAGVAQGAKVKEALKAQGLVVSSFNSSLLFEPDEIMNGKGTPFQVFTPYWNACLKHRLVDLPKISPPKLRAADILPETLTVESLGLLPKIPWASGIAAVWTPGEKGAHAELKKFTKSVLGGYAETRNLPYIAGTSRLSPYLHFGEIGPRQVWEAVAGNPMTPSAQTRAGLITYPKELGWREFAHYLLLHFPHAADKPIRKEFEKFPWKKKASWLKAWERGLTGFPIVDAGMRELWQTGWMHNRVRMIVASFLVKHLLLPWQQGSEWFWDTLVDADLPNNTLGWQWSAGCGADAAPYFRIFNPTLQGEKFDPEGSYVKKWIPEIDKVPSRWVHRIWEASPEEQKKAGLSSKSPYVSPIIELAEGRDLALEAYQSMRGRER